MGDIVGSVLVCALASGRLAERARKREREAEEETEGGV